MGKHWMLCGTDIYGIKLACLDTCQYQRKHIKQLGHAQCNRGKDKSEYTGPGLKSYQFEIQLVSKLGVNPRKIFDALMNHCEAGTIDYFILNNKPMSQNPFKLTKVTTGWGAVHRFWGLKDGKVTLTLEEYAP